MPKTVDTHIAIRGLTKAFDDKTVLTGLDLDVGRGESLAVIGASGTGKSVLLKLMLGLLEADGGRITVDGADMVTAARKKREEIRRKFGMLFQGGALFDSLTIWENVVFRYRQGKNLTNREARDYASTVLAEVNLEPRVLDLYPAQISGGMQKRVALARCIADRPDILLFDEPTTGLDPITAGIINALIRRAVDRLGATALTITHDMASVKAIADRVAMVHLGQIIWHGSVEDMGSSANATLDQFVHGYSDGPLTVHAEQA